MRAPCTPGGRAAAGREPAPIGRGPFSESTAEPTASRPRGLRPPARPASLRSPSHPARAARRPPRSPRSSSAPSCPSSWQCGPPRPPWLRQVFAGPRPYGTGKRVKPEQRRRRDASWGARRAQQGRPGLGPSTRTSRRRRQRRRRGGSAPRRQRQSNPARSGQALPIDREASMRRGGAARRPAPRRWGGEPARRRRRFPPGRRGSLRAAGRGGLSARVHPGPASPQKEASPRAGLPGGPKVWNLRRPPEL